MLGVSDVLSIVARAGPCTLDELEAAAPSTAGFLVVLDTCVDSGWLDLIGLEEGWTVDGRYALTAVGRRILDVAGRCAQAA